MQPVAIVVPPKVVETGAVHGHAETLGAHMPNGRAIEAGRPLSPSISRLAALTAARKPLGTEAIVHANGYICRESFAVGDRPQNFYMIGRGSRLAIGLGCPRAAGQTAIVSMVTAIC